MIGNGNDDKFDYDPNCPLQTEIQQLKAEIEERKKANQQRISEHTETKNRMQAEINELKEQIKCTNQSFCYDLQIWVKDFLIDTIGIDEMCKHHVMSYQSIRKAAYTHQVRYYKKTPTWGDETYLNKDGE